MICDGCVRGDHCGPPGAAGPHCPCQHRPRRLVAASQGVEVPPMPHHQEPPDSAPEADVRPFVVVLTEWQRLHRAGKFGEAALLRKTLIGRLGRLGTRNDHA